MDHIEQIVASASRLGAVRALETLGLTAGEITLTKARSTYGKWFDEARKAGRIRPVRKDESSRGNGREHYRVVDIQEAYTAELIRAELKFKKI